MDDDPRIHKLLQMELDDLGYRTSSFFSGTELLDRLTEDPPDLILLDLLMPGISGIDCLKEIRRTDYQGAVLIFTALSDNNKRQEALDEGASAYVLKPDLFRELPQLIKQHLRP
ncbi:MAG: response regulator [Vulcanococcus sp.]